MIRKICNYETISYIIAGVLTTVVDYAVFTAVNEALKSGGMEAARTALIATAAAWAAAVLFAYIANKLVVFRNYDFGLRHVAAEASSFFAARALGGIITMFLMWIMTGMLGVWEYPAKVLTSAFNLVFNYIASKLFIFNGAGEGTDQNRNHHSGF